MSKAVLFSLAVIYLAVAVAEPDGTNYTTKYDNVDVDSILHSPQLFTYYFNCLLDKGPCSPDGKELKDVIPDVLETDCSKCSEKQEEILEKILEYLVLHKQKEFAQLAQKYDPNCDYRKRYMPEVLNKMLGLSSCYAM